MKDYELWVHWKQGDECANFISQAGDVKQGLIEWAKSMEYNAKRIRRLVNLFENKDLDINACTHSIILNGDEEILKKAVEEELISCIEYEEEEHYFEEDLDLVKKSQLKKANEIIKVCMKCKKELSFKEFYNTYREKYNKEKIAELWTNDTFQFFCCSCFNKMKCSQCNNYFDFTLLNDQFYFFCSECLADMISHIQDKISEKDYEEVLNCILEINNQIKNRLINIK